MRSAYSSFCRFQEIIAHGGTDYKQKTLLKSKAYDFPCIWNLLIVLSLSNWRVCYGKNSEDKCSSRQKVTRIPW